MLVRIKKEWKDELQKIAKEQGQTLTGLIRQILWEYLKENETE